MEEIIERKSNIKQTSNNWFKERMSRFKPVIFLKKNFPVILFVFLFSLSIAIGIWNIKKYEILDIEGNQIDEKTTQVVEEYLKENVTGKNFFLVNSNNLSKSLVENLAYVKYANVSKLVPNKMVINLELYTPKFVALTGTDNCVLLSSESTLLEELCLDSEDISACCTEYVKESNFVFFKSEEVEISDISKGKKSLLIMNTVVKILKIVESFGDKVKEVYVENGVVDVIDEHGRIGRFSVTDNVTTQLARYFVTMGKVRHEGMKYSIIDVRFERPVVKN